MTVSVDFILAKEPCLLYFNFKVIVKERKNMG